MPRTRRGKALAHLDDIETRETAQVVVCDTHEGVEAVATAWGEVVTTWPGSRAHWHAADWSVLAGRRVVVLAAASDASRSRCRDIARHLHGLECEVRIGLPEGNDQSGVDDWIADRGKAGAKRFLANIIEPYEPAQSGRQKVTAKPAPAAPIPDTSGDWLWRNEHFELLGHEQGAVYLRWGGEVMSMPMERLASPAKLRTLAPPVWWTSKTGEERITGEVAGQIGSGLARAARERGRMCDYDTDGSVVGLPDDRVLNLVTGEVRSRAKPDRIMRSLAVEPVAGEPSIWLDALGQILDHFGDPSAIVEYLRRWFGVSLTTDCSAEAMLLCIGKPGCGKSTILDTWAAVAGSYCATLPGSYVAGVGQSSVRHLVADLRGARVVRVGELPESGRWSSTEDVNALVSGETLKADKKHRDAVEFRSVSHLMISGNRHPRANPESGIYRRMRLLDLRVLRVRDDGLKARLRVPGELGKVLTWALEGLRAGGLRGHPVPAEMRSAVDSYRDNEDVIGRFVSEKCVRDDNALTPVSDLFDAFERWVEGEKGKPWTKSGFSRALNDFGEFKEYRKASVRYRIGIRLMTDVTRAEQKQQEFYDGT